jgi:excisionase family DNA binding protein
MEINNLPELLTVRELSELFRKRPEAILRGIKAKEIPAVMVGGTWLIPRNYVTELHAQAMRSVA